jgi:hypothetical protein
MKITNPSPRNGALPMRLRYLPLLAALAVAGGCDLDLTNPNSPPEQVVLNTPDGVIALAVGMQGTFAGREIGSGLVLNAVRAPALVTDEWGTTSRSLASDRSLVTGQAVDPSFAVVTSPYFTAFQVIRAAEDLIENAPNVGLSRGTQTGIVALARAFKAMSLGIIIQQYERVPLTATLQGNPLQPRGVVLDTVQALLESARADLATISAADLADFRARVQGASYNLADVVNAMLARYYLMDGEYRRAIEAAERVPLNRLNTFLYPDPNRNPIWGYSYSLVFVAGVNTFVTQAEAGDQRPSFWLRTDQAPVPGTPITPLRNLRQYEGRNDPFPIFLPDEMRLIRAEAHARLGELEPARTLINQVRTPQTSTLNEPVAGLPPKTAADLPTQQAILRQIAYERRYELYLQGLRWEDTRRFGPALAGETPSIAFLPLPQGECLYNPANPCR